MEGKGYESFWLGFQVGTKTLPYGPQESLESVLFEREACPQERVVRAVIFDRRAGTRLDQPLRVSHFPPSVLATGCTALVTVQAVPPHLTPPLGPQAVSQPSL